MVRGREKNPARHAYASMRGNRFVCAMQIAMLCNEEIGVTCVIGNRSCRERAGDFSKSLSSAGVCCTDKHFHRPAVLARSNRSCQDRQEKEKFFCFPLAASPPGLTQLLRESEVNSARVSPMRTGPCGSTLMSISPGGYSTTTELPMLNVPSSSPFVTAIPLP